MNINVIIIKNPFDIRDKDIKQLNYIPEKPVSFYTSLVFLFDEKLPVHISLNDKILTDEEAKTVVPRPDDFICIVPQIEGGNFGRTLLSIAVMAASIWAGGATGLSSMGWNPFNSKLGAALIQIGGGMLVNYLCPIQPPQSPNFNQNYGWGAQQPTPAQGLPIAITYGIVGIKAPAVLAKHVQTVGNQQKLNLLLCGGEGVCQIKDIKINDNPIVNFPGVEHPTTPGTNDQAAIDGFDETYSDQSIDYKLDTLLGWDLAPKQQTSGDSGTSLEIELTFPQGLYYVKGNNDYHTKVIAVRVQYKKVGNSTWTEWNLKNDEKCKNANEYKIAISDIAKNFWSQNFLVDGCFGIIANSNGDTPMRRTYRLDNLSAGQYEVRMMKYYEYGDDGVSRQSECHWTMLSQVFRQNFTRPNKVLLAIKALATDQLNGSMPTVTWTQTRCSIDESGDTKPNTVLVYNLNTSKYELKDSDNPAWICYDLIHRAKRIKNIVTKQYELIVQGVPANRINYNDFADWAAFCDNNNLKCNIYIDTLRNLKDTLDVVAIHGRGQVVLKGTKYTCLWDAPATPVGLITTGNVTIDSFSGEYSGKAERAKAVEVTFFNADKDYERDTITVYNDGFSDSDVIENPAQITLYGCTSSDQAYLEGSYRLRANKLIQKSITFKGDIDYINFAVNEVINVSQDVLLIETVKSGRVIDATASYIKLDRTVNIEAGKSYAVKVHLQNNDVTIERTVSEQAGETSIIHGDFAGVQLFDTYSFGESTKIVKPFRITKITRDDSNQRRTLSCIEYREELYDENMDIPSIDIYKNIPYAEVVNLAYDQETYTQKDGTIISMINLSWYLPARKHIKEVLIYLSSDNGQSWQKYASTKNTTLTISPLKSLHTYKVKVCTINALGTESQGIVTGEIYITGKDAPPSDVASITAVKDDPRDSTKVMLEWLAVDDVDLKGYEMRVGSSWDTAQKATSIINDTKYTYTANADGTYNFMVKAVDNSGNYSVNAASVSVSMKVTPSGVKNFKVTQLASDRSKVRITWDANSETDLSYYEIRQGASWETAKNNIIATQLKATSFEYTLPSDGSYTFLIKAVSIAGKESVNAASTSVSMKVTPSDVQGFTVVQLDTDRSKVRITWDANSETDLSYYEIRQGGSWETAKNNIIATHLKATSLEYTLPQDGNYNFLIKAVSIAGKESSNAAVYTQPFTLKPNKPAAGTIAQDVNDRSNLIISWSAVDDKDLLYYEVCFGTVWNSDAVIATTKETSVKYKVGANNTYTFLVRTKNIAGYPSNILTISSPITLNPADMKDFSIKQLDTDRKILKMTWTPNSDKDFSYYEIKQGTSWDTATPIATNIKTAYYDYMVTKEETTTFLIKAVTIAGIPSVTACSFPITVTLAASKPKTGSAVQQTNNRCKVLVKWDKVPDLDLLHYEVRYGADWGTATPVTITKETQATYTINYSGSHTFLVRAKSINEVDSAILAIPLTPPNATIEPSNVENFLVAQHPSDRRNLNFTWGKVNDADYNYYEIRIGPNWDGKNNLLATNIKNNFFNCQVSAEAAVTYLIKAISNGGKESSNSTAFPLNITLKPKQPQANGINYDKNDKSILNISWSAVADTDLLNYEVCTGTAWDDTKIIAVTTETFIKYRISDSGVYNFMVRAKTFGQYTSIPLPMTFTASIEPSDVQNFSVSRYPDNLSPNDRSKVTLKWSAIADTDFSYYEIKEGNSWNDLEPPLATRITALTYEATINSEKTYHFWIKAYNSTGKCSQNAAHASDIFDMNPKMPTNFTVDPDSNDKSVLNIKWLGTGELDLYEYELRIGNTWEDYKEVITTKETKIAYPIRESGDYKFMVKAKNRAGFYSGEVFTHHYAYIEPLNVKGFQAMQNGANVLLSWTKVPETDVTGYEIREGSTFENGALIGTGITETVFQTPVDTERNYMYHIKAINRAGKYSQNAVTSVVVVANLPPKNVIQTYDEISLQSGTHNGTEFGQSLINFSNFGGKFADYPNIKFSEVGGQIVLKLLPKNLIADCHFTTDDISKWSSYSGIGTIAKNSNGNLQLTITSAATVTGLVYDFPDILERSTVYVVETKMRSNVTISLTTGFIGQASGYSTGACNPESLGVSLTANTWKTFEYEFTTPTSTTSTNEPGRYLFPYGNFAVGNTIELEYARIYKKSGQTTGAYKYESYGEYLAAQKDMQQIITANISSQFISTALLNSGVDAKLQYRVSCDNKTWTGWQDFAPSLQTFRYVEFKVILTTTDITKTPEVNTLDELIDVPDVDKYGTATVGVGGATINYGWTYYNNPTVLPTAIGAGLRADLISVGTSNFVVKVVNTSGTDVDGKVTWIAKGY